MTTERKTKTKTQAKVEEPKPKPEPPPYPTLDPKSELWNPNYTKGLNLPPEVEGYVQWLMANDPIEIAYRERRKFADLEFEMVMAEIERDGVTFARRKPEAKPKRKRGRPPGQKRIKGEN